MNRWIWVIKKNTTSKMIREMFCNLSLSFQFYTIFPIIPRDLISPLQTYHLSWHFPLFIASFTAKKLTRLIGTLFPRHIMLTYRLHHYVLLLFINSKDVLDCAKNDCEKETHNTNDLSVFRYVIVITIYKIS